MSTSISHAASLFRCKTTEVGKFSRPDPFNGDQILAGYICRKKGLMGGSLLLCEINGVAVEPQLIHGTPKLAYPYQNNSDGAPGTNAIKTFPKFHRWELHNKWNGMNVLFFTYRNLSGDLVMTAKSKGSAILSDGDFGNFLTLTKEALANDKDVRQILLGWSHLIMHENGGAPGNAFSFELCGRKEPHLVNYNFDIALKPLFMMDPLGRINPCGDKPVDAGLSLGTDLVGAIRTSQLEDLTRNSVYRECNDLSLKYEYNHFSTEGKVLYLLDENGYVVDRTLYKIKPSDVEEVHWQTFDAQMERRVTEAVKKINEREGVVCEFEVQEELDMGPKEWSKFGKRVMTYVGVIDKSPATDQEVVVLCGIPGSGKSTLAAAKFPDHVRVCQDVLGSRDACWKATCQALSEGKSVVIDRCNFNVGQRRTWVEAAQKFKCHVRAVVLTTSVEECAVRVSKRLDHPTVPPTMTELPAKFASMWVVPTEAEGFESITCV